jgi:lipoyl(octanoyl) transferase
VTQASRPAISPRDLREERDRPLAVAHLGTVGYLDAWELQRRLVEQRRAGTTRDVLLLLEHPPVYTLGKRTDRAHLLFDDAQRAAYGIDLVEVDRGGDITYHGPGQLVGYPILKLSSLRGVVDYVRTLEELLIRALADLDVMATRSEGFTGVWVGDEKIAAIGVRVAGGGVTSHGFALNVAPDLSHFAGIVPCGIEDRGVCSLASLGIDASVQEAIAAIERAGAELFGATLDAIDVADLDADLDNDRWSQM